MSNFDLSINVIDVIFELNYSGNTYALKSTLVIRGGSINETPASIKEKYESNPNTNAFTDAEKANLSNQSGINTGDETTLSIQTKRPLKTVNGQVLEGSGNIPFPPTGVESVTGQGVDNADPANPTISFPDADEVDDTATTNKFITQADLDKLAGIEAGAQANTVDSVNGETGDVILDKSDIGLGNVDNTSDADKPISDATQIALNNKEDSFSKNTAFNKDFGTVVGTVLEGNTSTITVTQASDILSNNAKVSADGSVTTHNDVTSAGSGQIITDAERINLNNQSGVNSGDETDTSIKTKYENNANTNAFTDDEKNKLANLESSKFVGEFPSLADLQTAFPTAPVGSYAYVDTGVGQPVEKYIWDNNDSQWVLQQGQSTDETPASIKAKYESNPDTNAFTDAEQTNLGNQSGVNTGDEDTNTIQTKRPIKTIENQSLEGSGNIDLSKSDVGLDNVDNTSDANKPISNATQTALDNKENLFAKNTAFNKDFGTSSGTVLEGDTVTITPTQSSNIETNNTKISADGSVTTHNDVTSAGSGQIITNVERSNLNNQSGTNTGDETTATIQAKRPIKTVNGQSLEGSGNLVIGVSVQPYSELTYTSGDLTLIEIYDSISKTTLLTTKDFTYTNGLLTQILETDVATLGTKTTNLTYDVNDVLINIEKI